MDIGLKLLEDARDKMVIDINFRSYYPGITVKVGDEVSVIQCKSNSNNRHIGVNMDIWAEAVGEYYLTKMAKEISRFPKYTFINNIINRGESDPSISKDASRAIFMRKYKEVEEESSPSLRKIVGDYYDRINRKHKILNKSEQSRFNEWLWDVWYTKASREDADRFRRSSIYEFVHKTGTWRILFCKKLSEHDTVLFSRIIRKATRLEQLAFDMLEGLTDPYIDSTIKYY